MTTTPLPGGPASRAAVAIRLADENWELSAAAVLAAIKAGPILVSKLRDLEPACRPLAKWVHVAAVLAGVTPAVANARIARALTAPSEYLEKTDPRGDLRGYLLLIAVGVPGPTIDAYQEHGHDAWAVIHAEANGIDLNRGLQALDLLAANGTPTAAVSLHLIDQSLRHGDATGLDDPAVLAWRNAVQGWSSTGLSRYWPSRLPHRTETWTLAALEQWVTVAGPDGWAWAAAGFTPDETRVLRALPKTHPDRPGPDQLAVMAALRTQHEV